MAAFEPRSFDYLVFDCGVVVNPRPVGWKAPAAQDRTVWSAADAMRGAVWLQSDRATQPWTGADYMRGAVWLPKPKSGKTW